MAKITIENFRYTMIKKAQKRGGVWENFGQNELSALKEDLTKQGKYNPYWNKWSTIEEQRIGATLDEFNRWCCTFDLSKLK